MIRVWHRPPDAGGGRAQARDHSVDPSTPRALDDLLEKVLGRAQPGIEAKRALLDADGCEAQSVDELDHRQQVVAAFIPHPERQNDAVAAGGSWVPKEPRDEPRDERFGKFDPRRHIFVEVGTGYNSVLAFNPGEPAAHIAARICHWNDVCRLRRLTDSQVVAKVEEALAEAKQGKQGVVPLWALDLGEPPFGFSLDTSHLSRCTSCVHSGVPTPPQGAYPNHSTPQHRPMGHGATDIARKVQLMVDNGAIASMEGLERVSTTASKVSATAVVVRDRPWEDNLFGAYPSLIHNGSHFKLWYWATKRHVAYAHSTNGVDWVKPSLGLVDLGPVEQGGEGLHTIDGRWDTQRATEMGYFSTELADYRDAGYPLKMKMLGWPGPWQTAWQGRSNNLVAGLTSHATVMRDPNDQTGESRYKALFECHHAQTCLATSPDGMKWRVWNRAGTGVGGSPITGRAADTYSQLLWDPESTLEPSIGSEGRGSDQEIAARGRGRYILHTRTDFGTDGGWREIRGHRTMRWRGTGPLRAEAGREPEAWDTVAEWYLDSEGNEEKDERQVYYLTAAIDSGVHLGFVGVINRPRDFSEGGFDTHRRHEKDVRDVYLAPSRDGAHWDLGNIYTRRPFIERGAAGEWDSDQVVAGSGVATWGDRHWIAYLGMDERHDAAPANKRKAIGMATIPLHRWASMTPGVSGLGWLLTVPFTVAPGAKLRLNVKIPEGGRVVVEAVVGNERVAGWGQSQALVGPVDALSAGCVWGNGSRELGDLEGERIQLRITLQGRGTALYAFSAAPA